MFSQIQKERLMVDPRKMHRVAAIKLNVIKVFQGLTLCKSSIFSIKNDLFILSPLLFKGTQD